MTVPRTNPVWVTLAVSLIALTGGIYSTTLTARTTARQVQSGEVGAYYAELSKRVDAYAARLDKLEAENRRLAAENLNLRAEVAALKQQLASLRKRAERTGWFPAEPACAAELPRRAR
jgi:predicted RNase H-like nuclease (RuvC/YqgF family)